MTTGGEENVVMKKPDKIEYDSKIAEIQIKIKQRQENILKIRDTIEKKQIIKDDFSTKVNTMKNHMQELKNEKDSLITSRNDISNKINTLKNKKKDKINSVSKIQQTKYKSIQDIDNKIKELEIQQNTVSMSLADEKQLLKQIEALKNMKKNVVVVQDNQKIIDEINKEIDELNKEHGNFKKKIDNVQEIINKSKQELDEIYQSNNNNVLLSKLIQERKDIKIEIEGFFNQIKDLKTQFKKENDGYFTSIKAIREKKKLELKKEIEKQQADYNDKLEQYEEEMKKIHPYQKEVDLCDALILFLKKNYAKHLSDNLSKSSDKNGNTRNVASTTFNGMKPFKREEEDFIFIAKSNKNNKKQQQKKNKEIVISLPIAQSEIFFAIGLPLPKFVSELPSNLIAIEEKKLEYMEKTERDDAKTLTSASSVMKVADNVSIIDSKSEKPMNDSSIKKFNKKIIGKFNSQDHSAFPTLGEPSLKSASPVTWGPLGSKVHAPTTPVNVTIDQHNNDMPILSNGEEEVIN